MAICRAFIINAPSAQAKDVKRELMSRDRFCMIDSYVDDEAARTAVIFFTENKDYKGLDFYKVADLVTQRGEKCLPLSAFRDCSTFSPWPANFATIELG